MSKVHTENCSACGAETAFPSLNVKPGTPLSWRCLCGHYNRHENYSYGADPRFHKKGNTLALRPHRGASRRAS
jgi:hypothetical protein